MKGRGAVLALCLWSGLVCSIIILDTLDSDDATQQVMA